MTLVFPQELGAFQPTVISQHGVYFKTFRTIISRVINRFTYLHSEGLEPLRIIVRRLDSNVWSLFDSVDALQHGSRVTPIANTVYCHAQFFSNNLREPYRDNSSCQLQSWNRNFTYGLAFPTTNAQ